MIGVFKIQKNIELWVIPIMTCMPTKIMLFRYVRDIPHGDLPNMDTPQLLYTVSTFL